MRCTSPYYDALYAKWLDRPGELLEQASYRPEEWLLDLCGGTGIVSRQALSMGGQHVFLADIAPRCPEPGVVQFETSAEKAFEKFGTWVIFSTAHERPVSLFDVVVCRQAINYLDLEQTAFSLSCMCKAGARFVFNTFHDAPRYRFRCYDHEERFYAEASLRVCDRVMHLQHRFPFLFDFTVFRAYTEGQFRKALEPFFRLVEIRRSGNSARYLWERTLNNHHV